MTSELRIALFVPSLIGGGAERSMVHLANGMVARGVSVDLILVKARGPYLSQVSPLVRMVDLGAARVSACLPALVRYLRRMRPAVLLSTLNHANVVAVAATRLARVPTRTVVRQANTLSMSARGASRLIPRFMPFLVRRVYPWAGGIVAVTQGVARDLAAVANLPLDRIQIIPNPVVTSELFALANERAEHAWLDTGEDPVVLGVGRLTKQKDFPTLIRAFDEVRRRCPARLIILGEGEERPKLESLVKELRLNEVVSLPGFVRNPFAYMARAAVFVLPSVWEGLPGALIQALACGVPVVATDCVGGSREILGGGRYGRLVPVGDTGALADAIGAVIGEPRFAVSNDAWSDFTQDAAVDRYLAMFQAPSS